MKKSYNSIRLVRVGKAGETQFERGSIEDTVRRISRGDNLKLDSLGQTLLSVLHTDLPPLPTKPVRRLSSKISVPVKSGHWRPKQRPSAPGSSFQDLLSHITTGREKPQTKSGPASEIEPASRRKEGTEASRERMMMPPPLPPPPAPAPAAPKRFSQILALSDESSSSEDEELDEFVMQRLSELEAEEDKTNHLKRERAGSEPPGTKKRREDAESAGETQEAPEKVKKLGLENEILLRKENYQQVSAVLKNCQEMTFLLVLREGYSQFHQAPKILGSGFGSPQYLLVRIVQENQTICFIKAELWNKFCSDQTKMFFWQEFLATRNDVRKLVYDGKAVLNCILAAIPAQINLPPTLRLIDPIIGCWLLKQDHPVHTFKMVLEMILPDLTVTNLGSVRPSDLAAQTEALASVCRTMYGKLEELELWKLFYNTEMRILPSLVSMERAGLTVDQARLEDLGKLLQQKMLTVRAEAERQVGKPFNLSSPKQVREILYTELKLDQRSGVVVASTAGGEKSTSENVLLKLKSFHPLVGLILQHRQLTKYKTTYVDGILSHLSHLSRVSTCWDQIAAATGRVTSVSPNLQAVPKGVTDLGGDGTLVNIRAAFQPSAGRTFLSADFEQIEFRIFGHLSQDPQINQALREGGDVFNKLAAFWLDKSAVEVSEEERDRTKRVVYALMYGAGKARLSEIFGFSQQQAAALISSFYIKFSTVRSFQQRIISLAERHGYLTTVLGRRRYFPHISSSNPTFRAQAERQAFNFLIQGSAADIAKTALLRSEEKLAEAGVESVLVMMIHDEMVWEVRDADLHTAASVVKETLETSCETIGMRMETKARIAVGKSWGELSELAN